MYALDALAEATRSEIAERAGLTEAQVWRRLSELEDAALIAPAGTRAGSAGRAQTVYVVTAAGHNWIGDSRADR